MTVFVTVGSTSFDDLIKTVCSDDILQSLAKDGFNKVVLQIGRGTVIPEKSSIIDIEHFRYKDNISEDIAASSLIIGHAGAGTILESLVAGKPLIAILNDKLMDNHQSELAEQMGKDGYLLYCPCSKIKENLEKYSSLKSFRPYISEPDMFPAFLERFFGTS